MYRAVRCGVCASFMAWALVMTCLTCISAHEQPDAHCKLEIHGYGLNAITSSTSNGTSASLIASASLKCSGTTVTVGINSTALHSSVAVFEGVRVENSSECSLRAAGGSMRGVPVAALLYFCDSTAQVLLHAPVVHNVFWNVGTSKSATALFVFAGNASVTFSSGAITDNQASSAIVVAEQATVTLQNNTILSGNQGSVGVGVYACQNASLVIADSAIENNTASASTNYGGGIYAAGYARVLLNRSKLVSNVNGFAGGWYAKENASIAVYNSVVVNNTAAQRGGGCFMEGSATVSIINSHIRQNRAARGYGGGIYLSESNSASVQSSTFEQNYASFSGGAAFVRHSAVLNVSSSNFADNVADIYGAAIYCQETSTVTVGQGTRLVNNTAGNSGGALSSSGSAKTISDDSVWTLNRAASDGGAAFIYENSSLYIHSSSFSSNVAGEVGGAVSLQHTAKVFITESMFGNNTAAAGGALGCTDGSQLAIAVGTIIIGNTASRLGGGVTARRYAKVNITGGLLSNNTATSGGALSLSQSAAARLIKTAIYSNQALEAGGGIHASLQSQVLITSSRIQQNIARGRGGGVACIDDCVLRVGLAPGAKKIRIIGAPRHIKPSAEIPETAIVNNTAYGGWGGGIVVDNAQFNVSQLVPVVYGNTALYAADVHAGVANITLLSSATVDNFVSRLAVTEGVLSANLHVSGYQGMPSEGALVQAVLSDTRFLASNRTDSRGNVSLHLKIMQPPGQYKLSFVLPEEIRVAPANMSIAVRSCIRGEVMPGPDSCLVCPAGFYSFNTSEAVCSACPNNAQCPGGDVIVPEAGYWMSNPDSNQVHRCPNPTACQPPNQASLHACASDPLCRQQPHTFSSLQCSSGYSGNMCGVCAATFASAKPFHCRECMPSHTIMALYAVAAVVMLGFMKLLVVVTMSANKVSQDSDAAIMLPSDLLRPLLLYSQYILVIGSLNIEFPASIAVPFQAVAWFWAPASPETLSIDCLLSNSGKVPLAIQRVLFYLCAPLLMLLVLLLLEAMLLKVFNTRHVRAAMADRLFSSAFVAAFFFLPSVARTTFSMFACVPVDMPAQPPYNATAVGAFWALDMNAQCFMGFHKAWALGLGVPLLFLLCIGLPFGILYKTWYYRHALNTPHVVQHYGFLYRAYRSKYCWWECVVVLQTLSLVAISVFGHSLGPMYQALLINATLALILMILMAARPHVHDAAHRVSLHAMGCLVVTSYVVMSFVPSGTYQTGPVYGLVMGCFLLAVNLAFVLSVVWQLYKAVEWNKVRAGIGGVVGCVRSHAEEILPRVPSAAAASGTIQDSLPDTRHVVEDTSNDHDMTAKGVATKEVAV